MTALAPATRRRRALGWLAIGAALAAGGIAAAVILGIDQLPARGLLDPEAAGPDGSRALVQVLRAHGVEVTVARDRSEVDDALDAGADTLVIGDTGPLSDDAVSELAARAQDLVLVEPRARDLRLLFDGALPAGSGDGLAEPDCTLAEARRAGAISPGTVFAAGADLLACYPSGGGHGLLVRDDGNRRAVAVDGTALFTNAALTRDGAAALGANLLGRHSRVVWYLPSLFDGDRPPGEVALGEVTPAWVTPAIALLACAAVVAAVWRGRRLGPLVRESLPVTVRASETTEGRARLYARSGDAAHAIDQLRIGALRRLARLVGLGPAADVDEIADAVAALLGADRAAVRDVLYGAVPRTDRELVDLADRLRDLESAAARTLHPTIPERNTP
ncbi:DUF4350 domain-containing protein [Microbacterium sp.]|uniref:DUF4350 domain-containing protein n=1 Tax=Microbacterium sp. TaxID=51671 RepID=UPI0039E60314